MVAGLTERQKEVLKMRYSGMKIEEIADKLNTSSANISKIMRQSRKKISGVGKTIETLRALGVMRHSAEIDLTEKGNRLMEEWRARRAQRSSGTIVKDVSLVPEVFEIEDVHSKYAYATLSAEKKNPRQISSYSDFISKIEPSLRGIVADELARTWRELSRQETAWVSKKRQNEVYKWVKLYGQEE
jgi:DNA-binding CsgD family transcriptional regulator